MEFENLQALKTLLCELGWEDAIVFENPDFLDAVVGVDNDGRVIYDYDTMLESLMLKEDMSYEDSIEFVDYNTIRSLPYMGEKAPIIMYRFHEDLLS